MYCVVCQWQSVEANSVNYWKKKKKIKNECVLMSGIKTAYSTAYYRLLLMVKSGEIGDILSVETTCTSLNEISKIKKYQKNNVWSAMDAWGATALMPIFQILGTDYVDNTIISKKIDDYFDISKWTLYIRMPLQPSK